MPLSRATTVCLPRQGSLTGVASPCHTCGSTPALYSHMCACLTCICGQFLRAATRLESVLVSHNRCSIIDVHPQHC